MIIVSAWRSADFKWNHDGEPARLPLSPANGSTAEKPQSQEMLESSDKWWLKTFTICSPKNHKSG